MKPQAKAIVGVCLVGTLSAVFASVIIGQIEARHAHEDRATREADCRLKSNETSNKTPGAIHHNNGCQTPSP